MVRGTSILFSNCYWNFRNSPSQPHPKSGVFLCLVACRFSFTILHLKNSIIFVTLYLTIGKSSKVVMFLSFSNGYKK